MSTRAWGVDVSSWQPPAGAPIDWPDVRAAGASVGMVKATQGDNYTNPWLKRDLGEARAAGLLVGAYHFYEAGVAPEAQSARFTESLVGEVLELGACIDWEPADMPDWEATSAYNSLLSGIHEARNPVGVYLDQFWWQRFKDMKLTIQRVFLSAPSLTEPPAGVFMWQRAQQSVKGISDLVDVDELVMTRGINLTTFPAPKSEAPAAPPEAPAAEPAAATEEQTEPPGAPEGHEPSA